MWEQIASIVKRVLEMLAVYLTGKAVQRIQTERDGYIEQLKVIREVEEHEKAIAALPDATLDDRLRG